jgi:TonB family protein
MAFASVTPALPGAAALIGRRFEHRIQLISQEASMGGRFWSFRMCAAASAVVLAMVVTTAAVPLSVNRTWPAQTVYQAGEGVTLPRVVREVKPEYTPEALQARIQGTVLLAVVVLPNGDIGDVVVKQSLDAEHGLDDQAVEAAKQWKFEPGTKDQTPVAVEITLEFRFTLK